MSIEIQGGGTVTLADGSDLTCTVQTLNYKGFDSIHALLVPEKVTLDLNGGTLRLDMQSNSYGVRLAGHSAIVNGTVRVTASKGAGSQSIWHSAVSVGAAYGDGGTAAKPSYFSKMGHWKMENLVIDQPFDHSAIQLMSEVHDGIIRKIKILDSDKALLGIGMDWGTVGPLHMPDELQPQMRKMFERGETYGAHPHDILIEDIHIGRLKLNVDDDSCGIRTSSSHNITIRNVVIEEAGVGVGIKSGDAGYEYAQDHVRGKAHSGYVLENFEIKLAHRKGIILMGLSDNIYRAVLNHGHDAMLDVAYPGIDRAIIRNGIVRGARERGTDGVSVRASTGSTIENVTVDGFDNGVVVFDWTKDIKVINNKIYNSKSLAVKVSSSTAQPDGTIVKDNEIGWRSLSSWFYDRYSKNTRFENNRVMRLTPSF